MAFPQKLLNDGEHVVVSTRTHPKALVGPLLLVLVGVVAAALLTAWLPGGLWTLVVWVLAAVLLLWFAGRPFLRWATTTYTFTNRRFMKRSGLVAKAGRTIPLNRISGVDFEIGVVDRLFGCGTLIVSDASELGRVELHDIPRVEQVQLRVAEELHQLSENRQSDDGA